MKKHYATSAKVCIDASMEMAQCPGAAMRVIVGGQELFVTGVRLEETSSLGGRQRVWTLDVEAVED